MSESAIIAIGVNAVVVSLGTFAVLWFILRATRRRVVAHDELAEMLSKVEPVPATAIAQMMRWEADALRQATNEQSRGLRQEVADGLRGSQEITISSFGALSGGVTTLLHTFGERLDISLVAVEKRVGAVAEKLDVDIAAMGQSASLGREALRQTIETRLDVAAAKQEAVGKNLREELGAGFHRLGAGMSETMRNLGDQQRERLTQTTQAITDLTTKSQQAGEALKTTVEGRLDHLRTENSAKLDEMRQVVDEKLQSTLEMRLGESFNRVVEQLNRVHEGLGEMKSLASNVGDLKNVLTNVKVRGTFGEVQLELLMEQFLARDQYVKDAKIAEHSSERVEFALKMPGGGTGEEVLIPIDAKFPRETYERLIEAFEAGDEELVKSTRKQLEAQVRACAKTISEKYINPPLTTNFAILFLPTEGLYAEVLRQAGTFEGIQRDFHVTLAGPTTLAALLNALQMGFRSLAIERRSGEVWKVLGAVRTEFGKYNTVVQKLGRQLATAAQSVDTLGVRTRAMDRKLRGVEAMPDDTSSAGMLGFDEEEIVPLETEEQSCEEPIRPFAGEVL